MMDKRLILVSLLISGCSLQCCDSFSMGVSPLKANTYTRSPSVVMLNAVPGIDSNSKEIGDTARLLSAPTMKNKDVDVAPSRSSSGLVANKHTPHPVAQTAVSLLFALSVLLAGPLPSNAGFGSGGAAVTSFPEIKPLSTEDFLKLSPSKQRQREFSVSCLSKGYCETGANRLYENVKQFNSDAREETKLQEQLAEMEKRVLTADNVLEGTIESRGKLEESLKLQTELLDKLGKQPAWVSCLAAGVGSTVSTLIMHPVDTIKVQLMNTKKKNRSEEEIDEEDEKSTDRVINGNHKSLELPMHPVDNIEVQLVKANKKERSQGKEVNGRSISISNGRAISDSSSSLDRTMQPQLQMMNAHEKEGCEEENSESNASLDLTMRRPSEIQLVHTNLKEQCEEEHSHHSKHDVDAIEVELMHANEKERSEEEDAGIDFLNVYKGVLANILKEAPSSALYLGIYEFARTYLTTTPLGDQPLVVYLMAGAVGELFGSLLRAPAEAVKTRLQVGISDEDGTEVTALAAAKQVIFTPSGRANLFSSWSTSLLRDIPMGAIQLAVFESAKTFVISSPTINLDVSTLSSEALFGAIGGSIAAFITTPADVITTISINSLSDTNLAQYQDKSPMEVLQMLYSEGGINALFVGWRERTIYWTPAIGIFLSIYCGSRQMALSVFNI